MDPISDEASIANFLTRGEALFWFSNSLYSQTWDIEVQYAFRGGETILKKHILKISAMQTVDYKLRVTPLGSHF